MIQVTNLTKKYGNITSVNHIDFHVAEGEILGLLGPNGAGKSSTMNMLTGYLSASEGEIKINDINLLENPSLAKRHIGYLPEIPPLYPEMSVYEYLSFVCKLKKIKTKNIKNEINRVTTLTQIDDVAHRIIKNLSKGYKQRVGLAQALIGSPKVLILDEPTVGLDPKQIIEIRNLIKFLSQHHTIILSSHILSEISAICERIIIMNKGNIVASGTPETLTTLLSGSSQTLIRVGNWSPDFIHHLNNLEEIHQITQLSSEEEGTMDLLIESDHQQDIRALLSSKCYEWHYPLLMMQPYKHSLEEIFLQVTATQTLQKEGESLC